MPDKVKLNLQLGSPMKKKKIISHVTHFTDWPIILHIILLTALFYNVIRHILKLEQCFKKAAEKRKKSNSQIFRLFFSILSSGRLTLGREHRAGRKQDVERVKYSGWGFINV